MQAPRIRAIARAYLMSIAFWYPLALLMGLQYLPLDRQHLGPSLRSLLLQAAAHAFAFALWTPPIFYLVGKYIGYARHRARYLLFWSFGAAPFVVLYSGLVLLLNPPYDDVLRQTMPRTLPSLLQLVRTSFGDEIFIYIAIIVAAHAYEYLKRVRRQEAERYEYQQALVASELQALKMQLHPHFLFNTLHAIATLIDSDSRTAKAMIIKLSGLLRASLDRESADLIPLEEELKLVREYLDLEKMRFSTRLNIQWSIAPETSRMLVPQMILQPLVENAIRYGIAASREGGWIEIASNASEGKFEIRVRNSIGAAESPSNRNGIGLRNVEARLRYLYSGDASLHLSFGEDRTATVTLTLPALQFPPANVQARNVQPALEGKDQPCAFSSSMTSY
ncbi:MAG: histidine kinase [Candidatus Korobacteraceae bacterium]